MPSHKKDYDRMVYSYMHLLHGGFYIYILDKYIEPHKNKKKNNTK